eukprot:5956450-Pyramimonas_sp.AAC.1
MSSAAAAKPVSTPTAASIKASLPLALTTGLCLTPSKLSVPGASTTRPAARSDGPDGPDGLLSPGRLGFSCVPEAEGRPGFSGMLVEAEGRPGFLDVLVEAEGRLALGGRAADALSGRAVVFVFAFL